MHTYGDACEMKEMANSPLSGVGGLEAVGKAASQFYEVHLCAIYFYLLFNDFNSGYRSNNISAGRSPDRSGSISITWLGIILVMLQSVPKSWK